MSAGCDRSCSTAASGCVVYWCCAETRSLHVPLSGFRVGSTASCCGPQCGHTDGNAGIVWLARCSLAWACMGIAWGWRVGQHLVPFVPAREPVFSCVLAGRFCIQSGAIWCRAAVKQVLCKGWVQCSWCLMRLPLGCWGFPLCRIRSLLHVTISCHHCLCDGCDGGMPHQITAVNYAC